MAKQCRKRDNVMNKTNKINRYAVLWLNSQSIKIEDISKETGLSIKQVSSIIDKHSNSQISPDTKIETGSSKVSAKKPSKMKDLMITESVGRRQNVTIMTKSASEIADEDKKATVLKNISKPYIWKQQ